MEGQHKDAKFTGNTPGEGSSILSLDSGADNQIVVRPMSKTELEMVFGWAEKEGWNPGKFEVEAFFAINPWGYVLLTINDKPVASLLSIQYSQSFAFMALYIVKPEFRGNGYGKKLWDIVIESLANYETVGFSGVLERVEDYKKAGFKPYFLDLRWKGKPSIANKKIRLNNISIKNPIDISFQRLVDYDAKVFANRREQFLDKWISMPGSKTRVAIDRENTICGYGVISTSTEGYKIAPLYADNENIAEELLYDLCCCAPNDSIIYIDTPASNIFALKLAKKFGLEKVFKTMRMYRGKPVNTVDKKMFGLTGLELG